MKAGAAYTCLDPAFPAARKQEILDDAEAVALITLEAAGDIALLDLHRVTPGASGLASDPRIRSPMSSTPRARPAGPRA